MTTHKKLPEGAKGCDGNEKTPLVTITTKKEIITARVSDMKGGNEGIILSTCIIKKNGHKGMILETEEKIIKFDDILEINSD